MKNKDWTTKKKKGKQQTPRELQNNSNNNKKARLDTFFCVFNLRMDWGRPGMQINCKLVASSKQWRTHNTQIISNFDENRYG